MKARRIVLPLLLLLLISALLAACGTAEQENMLRELATSGEEGGLWSRVRDWLGDVAWNATKIPLIGAVIEGILAEMPAYNWWIAGAVLILIAVGIVSSILGALVHVGRRRH